MSSWSGLAQYAFNLFSHNAPMQENGYNEEEMKMVKETHKIWRNPGVAITATCIRVPVMRAHAESINLELENELGEDEVRACPALAPFQPRQRLNAALWRLTAAASLMWRPVPAALQCERHRPACARVTAKEEQEGCRMDGSSCRLGALKTRRLGCPELHFECF